MRTNNIEELAQRVFDLFPFWDIPDGYTARDVEREIQEKPEDVILYLLDYIDDINEPDTIV